MIFFLCVYNEMNVYMIDRYILLNYWNNLYFYVIYELNIFGKSRYI